jgi:hypothetical protein
MKAQQLIGNLIEIGIAYALVMIIVWFRKGMWERRAHRLAANSDIALPAHLVGRVARFLRSQYAFTMLVTLLSISIELSVIDNHDPSGHWARWLPLVVAGLPVALAPALAVLTMGPRWKASGTRRVAHPGSLPVRRAFTASELAAVAIGAVFAVAFGAWGLWRVGAAAVWWVASAATFACAAAACWYVAEDVMNRPSSASDEIELGWDDLFRFQHVRGLIAGAAWAPPIILLVLDYGTSIELSKSTTIDFWPVYAVVGIAVLLWLVFRQGRRLWRRAWLESDRFSAPPDR